MASRRFPLAPHVFSPVDGWFAPDRARGERIARRLAHQPPGAGAAMSLGNQIRALAANRARPNNSTMVAGRTVERRNVTGD